MSGTKSFYLNESTLIDRGMPPWTDLGYSLDIPANDIFTVGWMDAKPTHDTGEVWGAQNELITSRKPEYFAPYNVVRSNVLPQINIHDPRYHFERSSVTTKLF